MMLAHGLRLLANVADVVMGFLNGVLPGLMLFFFWTDSPVFALVSFAGLAILCYGIWGRIHSVGWLLGVVVSVAALTVWAG